MLFCSYDCQKLQIMKKLFLFGLFVLSCTWVMSQGTLYSVHKTESASWNTYTEKWVDVRVTQQDDMSVRFDGNKISVSDKARSVYRVTKNLESDKANTSNFLGRDEKNREVYLSIYNEDNTGYAVFMVMYYPSYYVKYYYR